MPSRVALVIGNANYDSLPALNNPVNDAEAVAKQLSHLGFTVFLATDLNEEPFQASLNLFQQHSRSADIVTIYYAGHAASFGEQIFLIGSGFDPNKPKTLGSAIGLNSLLTTQQNPKQTRLIIVDACLDPIAIEAFKDEPQTNPNLKLDLPENTVVSLATTFGKHAYDGKAQHGVYTGALLENLPTPNSDILSILRTVKRNTILNSQGNQTPHILSNLTAPLYLNVNQNLPINSPSSLDAALSTKSGFSDKPALLGIKNGISAPLHKRRSQQKREYLVQILCRQIHTDRPKICD